MWNRPINALCMHVYMVYSGGQDNTALTKALAFRSEREMTPQELAEAQVQVLVGSRCSNIYI